MKKADMIDELEDIIESGLSKHVFPYVKGNSIRINKYAIRENKKGLYLVFDCEKNTQIAKTHFKTSAVAIAKSLAEGKNAVARIEDLDLNLLKHYNDALFYRQTIKTSKDPDVRWTRRVRLEIAVTKTQELKQDLDRFIF